MLVSNIINSVRWCIDEEAVNSANLDGASVFDFDSQTTDSGLMNNIIKARIIDALRWISLYAPSDMLTGVSSDSSSSSESSDDSLDIIAEDANATVTNNVITPEKTLVRVIRVKSTDWHRAILGESLIKEDSGEYLQLRDTNGAAATNDRPQAALINTKTRKVEVWPGTGTFTLTYISLPTLSVTEMTDSTPVGIPAALETSFIYYLAYLLLSAYGDGRAKNMLDIATLNLGKSEDKQRQ